jgi:hypothetical protein
LIPPSRASLIAKRAAIKIDYECDAQQPEVTTPCVHSLFPHMGDKPCWYLLRNSHKPIPM